MFGGLAGWLIVITANAFDLIPPSVPWTAPVGLVLVAALVGGLAYSTHQRIQVRHERIEPSGPSPSSSWARLRRSPARWWPAATWRTA